MPFTITGTREAATVACISDRVPFDLEGKTFADLARREKEVFASAVSDCEAEQLRRQK
jgi:hypothetical protein